MCFDGPLRVAAVSFRCTSAMGVFVNACLKLLLKRYSSVDCVVTHHVLWSALACGGVLMNIVRAMLLGFASVPSMQQRSNIFHLRSKTALLV